MKIHYEIRTRRNVPAYIYDKLQTAIDSKQQLEKRLKIPLSIVEVRTSVTERVIAV